MTSIKKEVSPDELSRLFARSDELSNEVNALIEQIQLPDVKRATLTCLMSAVSIEHWVSQRVLLGHGLHLTGFALVRLQFETVVRSIWIQTCAEDDWVERFTTPSGNNPLEEPAMGPGVDAMLSTIATRGPAHYAAMLKELRVAAWKPMHSYVHGGVRPVAQALAGVTLYQVSAVLRNANGLGLMAANAITVAAQDPRYAGAVRQLQHHYLDCLPPGNPAQ